MNILSKLPGLHDDTTAPEEIDEAQAKKDRIAFHRDHVRNGPANFKTISSGQQRRAKERALKTHTRKARRRQIRTYLAEQREAATILGHLQAVGAVSYASVDFGLSQRAVVRSMAWIIQNFVEAEEGSTVEVTREVIVQSLTSALNRWQRLTGQPVSPLSPAYVIPFALSEA